ncbi:DTW domain-containing protein [Shewanella pneumatophori]|uniref:tRNA-uridine aminocarboxypropyltransferase n=1 Tax=Shewanella pneumatophori TaxID=314092 RepID=A0A9X1ZK77_9GAMM|nr:tRNA-uridine aminocarboxypropyltransferase [Shewanella pneumatophori]MCL1137496.1 DTW domain-containing protein [Shewanella pneumatophori]
MQIILLTHEREATRPTNTGNIALQYAGDYCQRIIWSRVTPSSLLLDKLALEGTALLFPKETLSTETLTTEVSLENTDDVLTQHRELKQLPETLVIIDATWQEARKMLRQSPYLKTAARYCLTETTKSEFTLRRNQVEGGLCTVECIIELFKQANMNTEAQCLQVEFKRFCQ